jgi:hypothetical protein
VIVDASCVNKMVLVKTTVLAPCVEVIKTVEASCVVVCCGIVLVRIKVLVPCVVVIRIADAN